MATKKDSIRSWREKLNLVETLCEKSVATNHRRVALLVDVFDDPDYREKLRAELGETKVDDFAVAETLDRYVADLEFSFLELRTVLEAFPAVADWKQRPVSVMLREAIEARRSKERDAPYTRRRSATISQVDSLEKALGEARKEANVIPGLKNRVSELTSELATLRKHVVKLQRENAELRSLLADNFEAVA